VLNYQLNLDQNYINYLIIGNKHMSLLNKIKEMISNPISVSYKQKKDYSKFDMIMLNPVFLFLMVSAVTWSAWDLSRPQTSSAADSALSNAMVYFERGDFDNAVLQLESVVEDHKKTSAAVHAKFYLGRTAFINGNNDKAMMLLSECASKLDYSTLKTEAYIMLGQLDSNVDNAIKFFNKAAKNTLSDNEVTYISILKAKRLAMAGEKTEALAILDNLDSENSTYKELFEEVYGVALSLN
jgi:tetratricopeptide (TPR) repeat protein